MDEAMKDRLTSRDLWTRALFMILFVVAYAIAELLVTVTVIVQFVIILITGSANELLIRFGNNLSTYVYQIIRFETFNTEERPFPFSDWPDQALEENRWLHEPEPAAAPTAPPVEPAAAAEPTPRPASVAPEPEQPETGASTRAGEEDTETDAGAHPGQTEPDDQAEPKT